MADEQTIGIVTVLYDSHEVVDDFFASLARQAKVPFKLYVIDNSAIPTTLERCRALARQHGIDAEFIFNNANVGVAKGNNQGIALALRDRCRWILLANNDTEFAAGTLETLLQPLQHGEMVATPKMHYYGTQRLIWYAGGRIDTWTMRTPHIGMREPDLGQYDAAGYTGYAPTCFLLVDAAVFGRVGMMDERYFVYYDDTDFMWRLRRARLRVCYVPASVVQHKVSTSTGGGESPFTVYYVSRNRVYFIRKHFTGVHRWLSLGYVLLTRLVTATFMPRPLAVRLWTGVMDGLCLPLSADVE